ncbi:MAG: hypothetical protein V1738_06440 [Patescibacteria group bacterium]
MKKLMVSFVAVFVIAATGCGVGVARFSSTPDDYRVSGLTTRPEAMVREASEAHVRVRNAETYDWAVRNGMAYPYYGGYAGTDMGYFYQGVAPYTGQRDGYMPGGAQPASREELEMVRDRADEAHDRATDSLRFHQQHRDWHRGQQGR